MSIRIITREDRVAEFNRAANKKTQAEGGDYKTEVICFSEELAEFNDALTSYLCNPSDLTRKELIKEWADVQVTLSNFAWFFDFNGQVAFNRVADSNMSKTVEGQVEFREDGKILKGPNYVKPDMGGL